MIHRWIVAGAGLLISVIGLGMRYSVGVFLEPIETDFILSGAATSSIFSIYMLHGPAALTATLAAVAVNINIQ